MDSLEQCESVGSTDGGKSSGSDSDSVSALDRTTELRGKGVFLEWPTVLFPGDSRYLTPLLVSGNGELRDELGRSDSSQPTGLKSKAEKTVTHYQEITDKMRAALKLLTFRELHILVQFWSPCVLGKHRLLTTVGQPFGVGVADEGLLLYRKDSVDKDHKENDLSPPARVFRKRLAEWTPDVTNYMPTDFPQQEFAIRCNLFGYLALPVFDTTTSLCVGVLELLMASKYPDYAYEVQQVHKALKTENLTSPQLLGYPTSSVPSELDKIWRLLKNVCDIYNLPLSQTWAVSPLSSFVAHDKILQKSCSSFKASCVGKVCMYTTALPFHIRDLSMWNFHEACRARHLEKSRGLVGRAFLTKGSCFCRDVTKLSEEEYPLVHDAHMCGLTSCFAVFLHGLESNDDYVLEFFLPLDITDPATYIVNLVQTLKQSIEVARGFELGDVSSTEFVGPPREEQRYDAGEKSMFWKQSRKRKIEPLMLEEVPPYRGTPTREAARSLAVSGSMLKRFCREHGMSRWPVQQQSKESTVKESLFWKPLKKRFGITEATFFMLRLTRWRNRNRRLTKGRPEYTTNIIPQNKQNLYSVLETKVTAMVTVKVSFKKDMIKFQIPVSSGLLQLESQVKLRFIELKNRSFSLKYVNGDNHAMRIACDDNLHNLIRSLPSTSTSNATIKLIVHLA